MAITAIVSCSRKELGILKHDVLSQNRSYDTLFDLWKDVTDTNDTIVMTSKVFHDLLVTTTKLFRDIQSTDSKVIERSIVTNTISGLVDSRELDKVLMDRLPMRSFIVITREPEVNESFNPMLNWQTKVRFSTIENFKIEVESGVSKGKYRIVGGSYLFNELFDYFHAVYAHIVDKSYDCDKFFPRIDTSFEITNVYSKHVEFSRTFNKTTFDETYLNLTSRIIAGSKGLVRGDRTGTGTFSIFGDQIRFDISKYVPLLTTKYVPWKSCVEELLWFMKGHTDAKILDNKGVKIWNGNSSREFLNKRGLGHLREGDCGANYSFQWRFMGQKYVNCDTSYERYTKTDQIANVLHLLRTDPTSRRIFLSAWNPMDLNATVLPPCHVSAQFYVSAERTLSCHMYQRSCDVFLGLPWNILSYTVLTYIFAKMTDLKPGNLIISLGDAHVYTDHLDQIREQMKRTPLAPPVLLVDDNVKNKRVEDLDVSDFKIVGYHHHPRIMGTMSV